MTLSRRSVLGMVAAGVGLAVAPPSALSPWSSAAVLQVALPTVDMEAVVRQPSGTRPGPARQSRRELDRA